jgi:hypothetical protein
MRTSEKAQSVDRKRKRAERKSVRRKLKETM